MSKLKFKWLNHLTRLGTKEEVDDDINRKIIFSNVIFISLPVVYTIFMLIDLEAFLQPIELLRFDQFIVPVEILLCFIFLLLNKFHLVFLSRFAFIITWPFLLHIIPIFLLKTPIDYYIAYPFGLVFHSILIQLMFSYNKEKITFWVLLFLNFIALIYISDTLVFFMDKDTIPNELINDKYFILDAILYWLLFNLVMFYVLYVIEYYINRLNSSKMLIEDQKEKLDQLNQNLENIVKQRTNELKLQNNKLRSYAYYNAHLLRAPFCRIKGLVYLQELLKENKNDEDDQLDVRLRESVTEFENVILKIKDIVHKEDDLEDVNNSSDDFPYRE